MFLLWLCGRNFHQNCTLLSVSKKHTHIHTFIRSESGSLASSSYLLQAKVILFILSYKHTYYYIEKMNELIMKKTILSNNRSRVWSAETILINENSLKY